MPAVRKYTDDELIAALKKAGSERGAARILGVNQGSVRHNKARLAKKGWSPDHDMTRTVPDGYLVKGVSSYYNKDGQLAGQWVKSSIDAERFEAMIREACVAACEELPKVPARKSAGVFLKHLMACYPIGDAHIGMLSWPE